MQTRRSRTEHWQASLAEVKARGGTIECTLDGEEGGLTWRLRVWGLTEDCVVVEAPTAFGHPLILDPGVRMRGTIAWTESMGSQPRCCRVGETRCVQTPSRVRRRRRVARTDLGPCPSGLGSDLCQAVSPVRRPSVPGWPGQWRRPPIRIGSPRVGGLSVHLANIGVGGVGVISKPRCGVGHAEADGGLRVIARWRTLVTSRTGASTFAVGSTVVPVFLFASVQDSGNAVICRSWWKRLPSGNIPRRKFARKGMWFDRSTVRGPSQARDVGLVSCRSSSVQSATMPPPVPQVVGGR